MVYFRDGISLTGRKNVRVDHIVSVELMGANILVNLWAQPLADSLLKDKLEGALHRLVCSGKMPLMQAQDLERHNWYAAYLIYAKGGR